MEKKDKINIFLEKKIKRVEEFVLELIELKTILEQKYSKKLDLSNLEFIISNLVEFRSYLEKLKKKMKNETD